MGTTERTGLMDAAQQLARSRDARRLALGVLALLALSAYVLFVFGFSLTVAVGLSMVLSTLLVVAIAPVIRSNWLGFLPSRATRRRATIALAVWLGVVGTLGTASWLELDISVAALLSVLVAVVAYSRYGQPAAIAVWMDNPRALRIIDIDEANDMIAACRHRLRDRKLQAPQRTQVVVNLAYALAVRSTLNGEPDGLFEATDLLSPIVASGVGEPLALFRALDALALAVSVKAYKHGDIRGVPEVAELLSSTSSRMPDRPDLMAEALFAGGSMYKLLAEMNRDPATSRTYRATATDRCREAIRMSSGSPHHAVMQMILAGLVGGADASPDELDEAIALARGACRQPISEQQRIQMEAYGFDATVGLAWLLCYRASLGGPSSASDTDEAVRLCSEALKQDRPRQADAAIVLAMTLALRETLGLPPSAGTAHDGQPAVHLDIPKAFRLAFDEWHRSSDQEPHRVAMAWAEWAIEHDHPEEAAEALWRLVATAPSASLRRFNRASREAVVAATQSAVSEAGYWLTRVGRLHDAVTALEHGRAMLFTGPARYVDPDLQAALAVRGRHDLWVRWLDAAARIDAMHRSQYGQPIPDVGIQIGPMGPSPSFSSDELAAWSQYDHVAHEIMKVLGHGLHDDPPHYDVLRRCTYHDVVVYVASATNGGYALIVDSGRDPVFIALPQLTADSVERRVKTYFAAQAREREWRLVLPDTLNWLGLALIDPLLNTVSPGRCIILIPLGPLGLLPLHAAPSPRDTTARPAFVVRYAPNARVAAAARRIAARAQYRPPRILAVTDPFVDGWDWLHASSYEMRGLEDLYGPFCVPLNSPTKSELVSEMAWASVWHFACHGMADLASPLDSAIVLADGNLTLREILERPAGEHRLAVLSCCDTDVPDPDLLDEIVSLPGAMLRAGVAGVVASQWHVEDQAAALLMLAFHTSFRQGVPPDQALARAQEWLRSATSADLHHAYPNLVPEPSGLAEDQLSLWCRHRPYQHPTFWAGFTFTGA